MHELSITRSVVAIAVEHATGPVTKVVLAVGALSGIDADAVRFCYDLCTQGTSLQGSVLEIEAVPGRGVCRGCGVEVALERLVAVCPCDKRERLDIVSGEELLVRRLEG